MAETHIKANLKWRNGRYKGIHRPVPGAFAEHNSLFFFLFLACIPAAIVSPVWAAAAHLPSWFPAQDQFSPNSSLIYEEFGQDTFTNTKGEDFQVRGHHWSSGAYLPEGIPQWDGKKVFDLIVAGLKQQGFTVDKINEEGLSTSLHKGEGDSAWFVMVSFSPFDTSSNSLAIVQQEPLTVKLTLKPPALQPEKVSDTQDLPYLTPLPGMKLTTTGHDDSPMDYLQANDEYFHPFGGSITKRYDKPAGLSDLEFALVYKAALEQAGWSFGNTNIDQGSLYAHYDKNGRNIYIYARNGEDVEFTIAEPPPRITLTLKPPAQTPEQFGDKDDFPYLMPIPGWTLAGTGHDDGPLDVYTAGNSPAELVGSGSISKEYVKDKDITNNQFAQAYATALTSAGWTLGEKNDDQGFLYAHYNKHGRDIWAYVRLGEHVLFQVADVGSGLKAALARNCKVAVYGLNFDFNKATLRHDAAPVLEQVLNLLKEQSGLKLEIGGHTDNVGGTAYNEKLSDRRAATVKQWLISHGIETSRLTTHGYGQSQPLVPNDSDAHRARNRRVELKKPDCKS